MARNPLGTAAVRDAIGSGYDPAVVVPWHSLSDAQIAVVASAVAAGAWLRPSVLTAIAAGLLAGRRRLFLCAVVSGALVAGGYRAGQAWHAAQPDHLGHFDGWAQVVGELSPAGAGVRVTLAIDGERYDAWAFGSTRRRLERAEAGEWVQVAGQRTALGPHARRSQVRHVVGRLAIDYVADRAPGSAVDRASARVRAALRRSAEATMPPAEAALFTGLVIGDDTRQPAALVQAFRAAGLSHLTAVSGQNLAYVIAVVAPLLRRLRPWWRWAASVGLIGWFMALTRFEPSVLRAGLMAMLAATVFVLGRRASPLRLLALAVGLLLLADPLLVWSVGFWLSVGATWGVAGLGPRLASALPGRRWICLPLGITLGAQLGVAVPSLLVFGRLPLMAIPANLLAVPVAGFVMLYGIPAAAASDLVPALRPMLMAPAAAATRWIEAVALLAARLQPPGALAVAGWIVVGGLLAVCLWRTRGPAVTD